MKELEIEIYGRVQGIGFRAQVLKYADENGFKGYVKNRDDGSVFVVAQGEEPKLNNFISWIRNNPGFSSVNGLSYRIRGIKKSFGSFEIRKENNYIIDKAKSLVNLGKSLAGKNVGKVPRHVAIIPDGNRRWAKERGLNPASGHYKSASYDNIVSLFDEARNSGVEYVSIWGFSTENWGRDDVEIKALFSLLNDLTEKFISEADERKICYKHIGRKDRIPSELISKLKKLEELTAKYSEFNVLLCLDYGGRDELLRAVNHALKEGKKEICEEEFAKLLDTNGLPDVDLIVRTSGEQRTSGFMPFQSVYAELYFADVFFPEFDVHELRKALAWYATRERRFGGDKKK
jgi:undecaprenyl diphosphate synthase